MSNTPSKKDVDDLVYSLRQKGDDSTYALVVEALAKWGTPQPVNLGFTIENRAGIDVLVWKDGGCQPATSAEVAMWKTLAAVQQPVVREPLPPASPCAMTESEYRLFKLGWLEAEAAHGITQKGGSNADAGTN